MKRWLYLVLCLGIMQLLSLPVMAAWSTPAIWSQNNKLEDRMPFVSGNTLYFVGPKYDIYQSQWNGKEWSSPILVPGKINSDQNELQPCVVQNGTVMYFARMSTTGTDYDFYRSQWNAALQAWDEPALVVELSTTVQEWDIWVNEDETLAYVTSKGNYGDGISLGLRDIWRSERKNGVWQTPVNVGAPVNSDKDEWDIAADKSGRLYFSSNRPGTVGDFDLFMADSLQGPVSILTDLSSTATDRAPFVSDQWFFFEGIKRTGSVGGYDLWYSTPQ